MPLYCISYDLKGKRDYDKLYDKLKSYGAYAQAVESTWFIVTENSAAEIRDNLKQVLDDNDEIIVIEMVRHWASYNLRKDTADWLKDNF